MGKFSVSLHAMAQGKCVSSTLEMCKIASASSPSGVMSGVSILEILFGWLGCEFQSVFAKLISS